MLKIRGCLFHLGSLLMCTGSSQCDGLHLCNESVLGLLVKRISTLLYRHVLTPALVLAFAAAHIFLSAAEPISLFNGKDLSGWEGDFRYWSVQDGVIVGETKTNTVPKNAQRLLTMRGEVTDWMKTQHDNGTVLVIPC